MRILQLYHTSLRDGLKLRYVTSPSSRFQTLPDAAGERRGAEIFPLTEMHLLLLKMIKHLGGDTGDNRTIYLLRFSAEPFDGDLVELDKVDHTADSHGTACEYSATGTREIELFMSGPILLPHR